MQTGNRNLIWLTLISILIGVALFSAQVDVGAKVLLAGVLAFAITASFIDLRPNRLLDRSRNSLTLMRMNSSAREALERAQRRGGGFPPNGLTLLDVGLISSQSSREGVVMRRTQSVTKDDDAVRPFVKLHVQPNAADQQIHIRFELIDADGNTQYVHEMRSYVRDGEANLLADHHLPLFENNAIKGGEWDLKVYIDGRLIALQSFNIAPSFNERYPNIAQERMRNAKENLEDRPARRTINPQPNDGPMSLEDLLRNNGDHSSQGNSTPRRRS